jgi:hypothetical protein
LRQSSGSSRRSDGIAEHDRDRAALRREFRGFAPHGRTGRRAGLRRGGWSDQLRDSGEQLASITDGSDTDLPKVFRRYVTEDLFVDAVLAKSGLVLVETETAKPTADVHGRASHGLIG